MLVTFRLEESVYSFYSSHINYCCTIKGVYPYVGTRLYYSDHLKQFTKPQFSFVAEELSSSSKRYLCKISYWNNGKSKHMDSGGYHLSKLSAQECAAKRTLTREEWLCD